MQKNLIFFSGPHGSGKSTLMEILEKEIPDVLNPELETRTLKFDINPEDRQILKICQRSLENYESLQIAKKNPDKIIFGNRCIYDQYAYNLTFFMRGWISYNQLELTNKLADNFFIQELRQPYAVVLNPPIEKVLSHLQKRWQTKGKKWHEEDMSYLNAACESYEKLKNRENILYIGREINLNSNDDVLEIREWLEKINGAILV